MTVKPGRWPGNQWGRVHPQYGTIAQLEERPRKWDGQVRVLRVPGRIVVDSRSLKYMTGLSVSPKVVVRNSV